MTTGTIASRLPEEESPAEATVRLGVNAELTPDGRSDRRPARPRRRPRRERETPEYADMVVRMIKAYARRVGDGDVEELSRMLDMHRVLDDALAVAVAGLRDFGYSWGEIAKRTGTSRQGVQQRWGR
jgi:hypothetical protein